MTAEVELHPVVIIGAARSGTKALRDAFSVATGVPAVPYDISYVWRSGNDSAPHDRQTVADVRPRTRRTVHGFLHRYADRDGRVIEKTVGSSLRVGYVREIVPTATFVHLIRNGVDVAESTRRQWLAPAELGYLRDKLRHVPPRLLVTYGRRHALSLLRRRVASDGRVGSWGPRYPGIDRDIGANDLLTVCARQWRASVSFARTDFAASAIAHAEIRYEDLVDRPVETLGSLANAAGWDVESQALARGAAMIRRIGGGAGERLSLEDLQILDREIGDLLDELGYERPDQYAPRGHD